MALDQQYREKFRSPELFLSELLKKSAQGQLQSRDGSVSFLLRATVIAVDTLGGQLENETGQGTVEHRLGGKTVTVNATVGPRNPRNSVKARVISDGFDQFMSESRVRVFWPFFPEHISVPVKPQEHVYVLFEDADFEHGLWVTKVPGQENLNMFRGQSAFTGRSEQPLSSLFFDTSSSPEGSRDLNTDDAAGEAQTRDGRLTKLLL